jgi:cell division protein FtsB
LIEELHARIENIEAENELLKRDKDAILKKVSTHH